MAYCYQLEFDLSDNQTTVNMTMMLYDASQPAYDNETFTLYVDETTPSLLYQDAARTQYPLMVVNHSSLPYWVNGGSPNFIIAFNYTSPGSEIALYVVYGISAWYDTEYDITPYLNAQQLPIIPGENYWFINTACDSHFGWKADQDFNISTLNGQLEPTCRI